MSETFFRAHARLGNTMTNVFTVPAGQSRVLIGAQVANLHTAPVRVTLGVTVGADTRILAHEVLLDPDEPLSLLTGRTVLVEGDILVGTSPDGNNLVDIWVSGLQIEDA